MALRCAEAQEGFAQRGKDRARIAAQLGAKILRAIEDAGLFKKIDAAVDLVHVVAAAERIERALRGHDLPGFRGRFHMPDGGGDARCERLVVVRAGNWRADRIVGLARAAARDGGCEHAVNAAARGREKQIAHGGKELLRRADDERRDIIGLDPEVRPVWLERADGAEDDIDEIVCHRIEGNLCAGKHRHLAPLALPRSA